MVVGVGDIEHTPSFPKGGVEGFVNRVSDNEWWDHGAITERGFGSA